MNETVEIVEKQKSSFEDLHLNDESVSGMMEFLSIDVGLSSGLSNREETLFSKNVMRKQRNWERRLEAKKSKRKEEKQRRKQNQQDKVDVVSQFSKRVIKAITRERLEEARAAGPRLCVDLSMSDCMSHKRCECLLDVNMGITPEVPFQIFNEISRLAGQIRRLYGSNKKAMQPFHLLLTDMKEDSLLYTECIRMNEGFLNYLIDVTEESWNDLFPCEDIIYLTPDASEALEEVNGDKVYILGGLVDESIQKKRSYTRAKELGVQMARLPIDEYMMKRPNPKNFHSKILAINQVFEILLTYRDTGSWSKALSAGVPTGKGYILSSEAELDLP